MASHQRVGEGGSYQVLNFGILIINIKKRKEVVERCQLIFCP